MKKYIFLLSFLIISVLSNFAQNKNKTFQISKNISIFNSVLREIDMYYVDTLSYDPMVKSAVDYMLSKLDPYTVYIPEEEADDLTFMTTGEYGGIGALISKSGNTICISEPYEGMPAQKNDIRAGDIIIEIDGQKIKNLTVSQASSKLKGTPNTPIEIKLERPGADKPITKKFMREKIQINPIAYSAMIAPRTGYILLNDFTENSAQKLKQNIEKLIKENNIESLVLDLRNNGGGLINEAVEMMGYFVPKGTEIVSTKGKSPQSFYSYKTTSAPVFEKLKLSVLVNSSSASAAEIVAGAIQDLDRGVIVGERTYGKGLVQNIRPINFGGHIKVTTAKYYIPSGRCVQAIDYTHRNEDGSVGKVPDSLTSVFKTSKGRLVRDGGGITPDTLTSDNRKMNIAYYIYMQNHYFDYATQFAIKNSKINSPSDFQISDSIFNDFKNYLIDKKFQYTTQTEKSFDNLMEIAKEEGLDMNASEELKALQLKLKPDISKNLDDNKKDICDLMSIEILKRYYFQKGVIEYSLKNDTDLKTAIEVLSPETYNRILQVAKVK